MTRAHRHLACLSLAAFLLVDSPAFGLARDAQTPATGPRPTWLLLDTAMQPTGARDILSISGDAVGFVDLTGAVVARPLSMVCLIVPAGWWTRTTLRGVGVQPMGEPAMPNIRQPGGLLETTDGQRIPGTLEFASQPAAIEPIRRPTRPSAMPIGRPAAKPPGDDGQGGSPAAPVPGAQPVPDAAQQVDEIIRWQHPTLGTLVFNLDLVRRWSVDQQPWVAAAFPEQDILLLANGDKLEGFVVGIVGNTSNSKSELAVKIEPALGDGMLPVKRLRTMLLSGSPALAPVQASRLILADGTDVHVGPMQPLVGGKLKTHLLASATPASVVRIDAPLLVGFAPSARSLVDLTETLANTSQPESPSTPTIMATRLPRTEPADLIAGSINMPGWCTAVMSVPVDARRLGMQVVVPESCRVYAECTLTVTLAGKLLITRVLTAKDPVAELNIPVSGGGELRITLADGPAASGPVHDRVVLRRPIAFR